MKQLWRLLRDDQSRKAVAFVATGLAAAIAAGWTLYLHLLEQNSNMPQPEQMVRVAVEVSEESSFLTVSVEETGAQSANANDESLQYLLAEKARSTAIKILSKQLPGVLKLYPGHTTISALDAVIETKIKMLKCDAEIDKDKRTFKVNYTGRLEINDALFALLTPHSVPAITKFSRLQVRIDTKDSYLPGEIIKLMIEGTKDFYAAIFWVDVGGHAVSVTYDHGSQKSVGFYRGNMRAILSGESTERAFLVADAPFGTDQIVVFASTKPFDLFEGPQVRLGSSESLRAQWDAYIASSSPSNGRAISHDTLEYYDATYRVTVRPAPD